MPWLFLILIADLFSGAVCRALALNPTGTKLTGILRQTISWRSDKRPVSTR